MPESRISTSRRKCSAAPGTLSAAQTNHADPATAPAPILDVGSLTLVDATGAHSAGDVEAAIRALRRTAVRRRRIAVVGVPSGPASVVELDALGRLAVRLDVHRLAAVGAAARAVHTGAYQEGSWDAESVHVPDVDAAREWLADELAEGDVVLVAGAGDGLAALARDLRSGVLTP